MIDAARAAVWQASWKPFGEQQAITGPASLDARFPGQWFQLESGLHQNWWRHYDPTTGRYTQVDPLGFVDGPGVYGYARQRPTATVDPRGQQALGPAIPIAGGAAASDGPLPFGDAIGVGIIVGAGVYVTCSTSSDHS